MKNMFFLLLVVICRYHPNLYNSDINKEEQYSLFQDDLHQLYGPSMPISFFDLPNDSSNKSSNSSCESRNSGSESSSATSESSDSSDESSDSSDEEKIYEKIIVDAVQAFKADNMDRHNRGKKLLSLQLPKPDLNLKGLSKKQINTKFYSFFNTLPISFENTKTKKQMLVGWCPEQTCSFAIAPEYEKKMTSRMISHIAAKHNNLMEYDIDYSQSYKVCWEGSRDYKEYFSARIPLLSKCYAAIKYENKNVYKGFAYPCQVPGCNEIKFSVQKRKIAYNVKRHNVTHLHDQLEQKWQSLNESWKANKQIECEMCLYCLQEGNLKRFKEHCAGTNHVSYNENL